MRVRWEFWNCCDIEVVVFDVFVDCYDEGMMVFEFCVVVDVDIDIIEEVLLVLKDESFIVVEEVDMGVFIYVDECVVLDLSEVVEEDVLLFERFCEWFGF